MNGPYRTWLIVGGVAVFLALIVSVETLVMRMSNSEEAPAPTLPSVVATIETTTTTTTTLPIPTTLPTTTTTRPRPATTTTTTPEPEVQGEAVVADNASVSLDDPDMDEWRAIARCEMPGPGGVPSEPWGVHWSFRGTWSGSLGVYNGTWLEAGGGKYGPTAGHATWQQQIEIARNIRDKYGYRAWGCGRKLGLR